ncbi:DUF885 domain-containing protein [Sphingobium phenoxybenzoativorans]|uniref:DUF885 domain-containing protein n=1 Tax=Sphingobium phenoxybenzoativorans TaxID=1592790 RepID=A0A975K5Y5_9SPHN|nr:DUF885 domain-containing protein [Sphingobium phenoxybenzoativorans]QUT04102.1 DUF885 domain-containing protein [Sphingobium phenoxybenzoativorans]
MRHVLLSLLLAAVPLTACSEGPSNQAVTVTDGAVVDPQWDGFSKEFIEGYFKHDPYFAVYQGRHDFDGQLPDWSEAGLKAQIDFLKGALNKAEGFDTGKLSKEQAFEREYLISVVKGRLFWLEDADKPHRNPSFYIESGLDPNVYIARPYADPATRMKAFIAFAKTVPGAAVNIRANLKMPMPASFIDFGTAGFKGLADYYTGDAKAAFASVKDEALQKEFDEAAGAASKSMRELAIWLENGRKTQTQDFALGADRFSRMLSATEMVDTPLDELEKVGQADLKRNQDALKAACATFAPGADIPACMAKMNARKPEGGVVAAARKQLPGLKAFIAEKDIVSIPGTEEAQVEESPPYNRQNSAYIDIPGPYEKGLPSVYYISPPDPAWSKAVQDGYVPGEKDLLFTSVHEVWPGHFLNFLHSNRSKFTFGKIFVGYAFAEGWAHYAEEMMWDAGLGNGDPETHIGQLSNALLRDCRYLSAIGMHARGMTQEQSRKMFVEQCYQDEGNARQQAARGTYDPAYLNYTMAKLLIRKLREDWTKDKGGRTAWKAFHDGFLSYGGPPIPLVRAQMMGGDAKAVF